MVLNTEIRSRDERLVSVYANAPKFREYVNQLLRIAADQLGQPLTDIAERYTLEHSLSLNNIGELLGVYRTGVSGHVAAFGFANTGSALRPITSFDAAPFSDGSGSTFILLRDSDYLKVLAFRAYQLFENNTAKRGKELFAEYLPTVVVADNVDDDQIIVTYSAEDANIFAILENLDLLPFGPNIRYHAAQI